MSLTKPFNGFPVFSRQNQLHKQQQGLLAHHTQTPAASAASVDTSSTPDHLARHTVLLYSLKSTLLLLLPSVGTCSPLCVEHFLSLSLCLSLSSSIAGLANSNPQFGCLILQDAFLSPMMKGQVPSYMIPFYPVPSHYCFCHTECTSLSPTLSLPHSRLSRVDPGSTL